MEKKMKECINCANQHLHQPKVESEESELRPITYLSKLRSVFRVKTSFFTNATKVAKFERTALNLRKTIGAMKKMVNPIKTIKTYRFKTFNMMRKSQKNLRGGNQPVVNPSLYNFISEKIHLGLNILAYSFMLYDIYNKINLSREHGNTYAFLVGIDTVLWHLLASRKLPGYVIKTVHVVSNSAFTRLSLNPKTTQYLSVGMALASIPFIITPIDRFTDFVLNSTFRKVFNIKPPKPKAAN